jgi:hypothetical protein
MITSGQTLRGDPNVLSPSSPAIRHRFLPWLGLLFVIALYIVSVLWLQPTNFFGLTEDDSIYFSSARALAEGRGYILPSVPGTPQATKYPILYPWLLSWVWRWSPAFPANLALATRLNILFGTAFAVSAFFFLRSMPGLSDTEALFLVATCVLHPLVLSQSANLMSDTLFSACAIGAISLAGQTGRCQPGTAAVASCGLLSGLSCLLRILGIPVAAALYFFVLLRRGWKKSVVFAVCAMPFLLGLAWRSMHVAPDKAPVDVSSCSLTWRMTWLYYTDYLGFWKLDSLHPHLIWHILKENAILSFLQPSMYFLDPRLIRPFGLGLVLLVLVTAGMTRGLVRHAHRWGWQPVYFVLTLYMIPLLFWDYAIAERSLIPFLPLFAAALWTEGRDLMKRIRAALAKHGLRTEGIAAGFLCIAVLTLLVGIGYTFRQQILFFQNQSARRAELSEEKQEAYAWLRDNTPLNSRTLAYEDASLFLYSGRQALRPVIFAPAGAREPWRLETDLGCIACSAKAVAAKYWLVAPDDFGFEWEPAKSRARSRAEDVVRHLPQAFKSRKGNVRVYDVSSLQ